MEQSKLKELLNSMSRKEKIGQLFYNDGGKMGTLGGNTLYNGMI